MAAESNEQSAPDKETSSAVQVGSDGPVKRTRRLPKPKISKRKLLGGLVIVVLLIVAGWILASVKLHVGQKVYAQAAGHKIYKQDVKNLIGNTGGISQHRAAAALADKYLTEAMAKDAGISVTHQDLKAQYPDIDTQKAHNKFVYQSDVNNVYFNKLLAYNAGLYKGKLLVANFSRHIAFQSPFLDIQEASDPLMGNQAAIAQDKKYAHDLITKLYNQVQSRKITFDQAIQIERDDSQVGLKAYASLPHSGPFDTSNVYLGATGLIMPLSIQKKIQGMKSGQLSTPFAVGVSNSLTDSKVTTESYYLVVRMDSTSGGRSGLSYDQYLAQAKKQFGYKVYV